MNTCTMDDCDRAHYAKGLCGMHYKRTRQRTPDALETVICDACGTGFTRPKRKTSRWTGTFCSYLCRDYTRWGALSSKLPRDHMARCIGATCKWSPPIIDRELECGWCGATFPTRLSRAVYCTPRCKEKAYKTARRAREHGAAGTYTWADVARLWLKFGKTCAYCATPTPLDVIEPDHVIALSRGGTNATTNLLPSCHQCNADKRDLLLTEWRTDRARRGLEPRITEWSSNDQMYFHLTTHTAA